MPENQGERAEKMRKAGIVTGGRESGLVGEEIGRRFRAPKPDGRSEFQPHMTWSGTDGRGHRDTKCIDPLCSAFVT